MDQTAGLLNEQMAYYRARAAEYDQWWLRQGRYNRGPAANASWFNDITVLEDALNAFRPAGNILELAGGTGLWSEKLLPFADQLTIIDGAQEALAINAARLQASNVDYLQADLFEWQPRQHYDMVFFSFWLSHVPDALFNSFWQLVERALVPDGRVFFIDSLKDPTSTALDHQLNDIGDIMERRLDDGRRYQIVKIFYEHESLTQRLATLGWNLTVETTSQYFIYGWGTRDN